MNNWPKQDYKSMVEFYGTIDREEKNQTSIVLPYQMKIAWDLKLTTRRIKCHKKVSESVFNIFEKTLKAYGIKEIQRLKLDLFGGCFSIRQVRNGSAWSIHSWGAAIDLAPDQNQLRWGRDRALFAKKDYEAFWKIVEGEGWVSLGRARNYDYMHFQAAKL